MILACGSVARNTRNRLLTSARGRKHDGHHGCQERVSDGCRRALAAGARPRRDAGPRQRTLVAGGGTTPPFVIILMVIPNGGAMTAATRAFSWPGPASARGEGAWRARLRRRREVALEQRQDRLAVAAHDLGGALGVPGARRLDEGVVLVVGLLAASVDAARVLTDVQRAEREHLREQRDRPAPSRRAGEGEVEVPVEQRVLLAAAQHLAVDRVGLAERLVVHHGDRVEQVVGLDDDDQLLELDALLKR